RLMAEKSILMFHPASGGTQGTLEQMLNQLTMFKKYVDRLDAEVAARSKISYAEFKSLLANELWLEAADALNMGFADKIAYVNYSLGNEDGEEVYDVRKEIAKTVVKDIKDVLKPLTTKQSAETVREFK
ncbi:MAG: ATP-dependent Clp protease proteolytic subunit, partial [Pirellulaceae bacterium]